MTKQSAGGQGDGSWFLEAVGAAAPVPTGAEALSELTKENQIVSPDEAMIADDLSEDEESIEAVEVDASEEIDDEPDTDTADEVDDVSEAEVESTAVDETSDTTQTPLPITEQPTQQLKTTQVTFSSFDGDPGTANATFATPKSGRSVSTPPAPEPQTSPAAPVAIAAAATAVLASPPPPTPAPQATAPVLPTTSTSEPQAIDSDLARQVRSSRSFRWPIVALLGLLIVIVAIAAFWIPSATNAEAVAVRQSYYDATAAVRNQLPNSQAALDVITNPTSSNDALNASIPAIAQLDTLAFAMQDVAAEPLPTVFPFVPKGAIDALEPLQETTSLLGEDGDGIAKRLGNTYIYRISIPVLLSPGNLPISAGTETINTISVTLAASLADDASVVAELPDDPTFATVQTEALASHDRYATWQQEYLAALTGEDQDEAQALINELDTMRTALNASNDAALATARTNLDGRIVSYAVELEVHMAALTAE